jgi:putative hydrolase of the HAD superfamily
MRHTRLGDHLDSVICAHDLGLPKEAAGFWELLQRLEPYDKARTLLIDDNLAVLRSAREAGITKLLAIDQPDSQQAPRTTAEFPAIRSFNEIMPGVSKG